MSAPEKTPRQSKQEAELETAPEPTGAVEAVAEPEKAQAASEAAAQPEPKKASAEVESKPVLSKSPSVFRNKKQRKQELKLRKPGYAVAKYVRMSPRKVRLVIDVIRGHSVRDAEDLLRFLPRVAGEPVTKVLRSAKYNALNNDSMLEDLLYIKEAYVDAGPTLKRLLPRARGSANIIKKRTSHITIIVAEREMRRGNR